VSGNLSRSSVLHRDRNLSSLTDSAGLGFALAPHTIQLKVYQNMGAISGNKVIEGTAGPLLSAGAPSHGTSEVQTLAITGTPTGGTFTLTFDGHTTAAIAYNAAASAVVSALEALNNIGTGGVTATGGALPGTDVVITFAGNLTKLAVNLITATSSLTGGTDPAIAITETTPGVTATGRGTLKGGTVKDTTNGKHYTNTGTALAPTWTVTGTQS
jgi:hypothetical protein